MKIIIDPLKKTIFIDGSYFIFYRFYATQTWYKLHNSESYKDFLSDEVFYEKYAKNPK